jgi:hypothetical protein
MSTDRKRRVLMQSSSSGEDMVGFRFDGQAAAGASRAAS